MKLSRCRLLTVLVSVLALLLSQAALAGYACPGTEKAQQIASMVEAGMPCAEEMSRAMDDVQPGLCHAHCQGGQQSADTFQPPAFAHAIDLGVVFTVELARSVQVSLPPAAAPSVLRGTGPPLAIQHCCWRI